MAMSFAGKTAVAGIGATEFPRWDPSPVIPSDLSFGYLSAELKSPVKIPIPLYSDDRLNDVGSGCANTTASCPGLEMVEASAGPQKRSLLQHQFAGRPRSSARGASPTVDAMDSSLFYLLGS